MSESRMEFRLKNTPSDCIQSVKFGPSSSQFLLVASWDKSVRLYDVVNNNMRLQYQHTGPVLDCCFQREFIGEGSKPLISTQTQSLWCVEFYQRQCYHEPDSNIWDPGPRVTTEAGAQLLYNDRHSRRLTSPAAVVSGSYLRKGCARIPSVFSRLTSAHLDILGESITTIACAAEHQPPVSSLPFSRQENQLPGNYWLPPLAKLLVRMHHKITQGSENMGFAQQRRESSLKYQTRCIQCFPNKQGYVVSSIEGRVAVEYLDPSPEVQKKKYAFKCHRLKEDGIEKIFPVNAISFHNGYNTFATGGSDGYVNIWDGFNKKRLCQFHRYPTSISSLCFSNDGNTLAIACSYMYEQEEIDPMPEDCIFIRRVTDQETKPK
ncbi:mitotic checkpoint protein BUB3-like [Penaeus japonicus]|uniref:mitotic checkpoint protein BUB3-like n=1 Tax=Penaeus japonicus TaxID=27405 RepID=UPI001C70EC66|nr:mitotic checkpoint protein BUB3-like [Penaeus japonicus]